MILVFLFILLQLCTLSLSDLFFKHQDTGKNKEGKELVSVILMGDSLVAKSVRHWNLTERVYDTLSASMPDHDFLVNPFIFGKIGDQKIRKFLEGHKVENPIPKNVKYKLFYLLWDCDVADVHEELMSKKEKNKVREKYQSDLNGVLKAIQKHGGHIFISSPGILGEGAKKGIRMDKPHYKFIVEGKEAMLDAYRDMTKRIVEKYDGIYIDIREAFLEETKDKTWFEGWVTMDGEHPNYKGVEIISTM